MINVFTLSKRYILFWALPAATTQTNWLVLSLMASKAREFMKNDPWINK